MSMFCYQCQQTAEGRGCTEAGVCGKDSQTACLQDLLTAWCKQIASTRVTYREKKRHSRLIDNFLLESLYATQTSTNFDAREMARLIFLADRMVQLAEYLCSPAEGDPDVTEDGYVYNEAGQKGLEEQVGAPVDSATPDDIAALVNEQAQAFSLVPRLQTNADIVGLQELILYGIRGAAANGRYLFLLLDRALAASEMDLKGMRHRIAVPARTKEAREERAALKKQVAELEKQIKDSSEQSQEFLDKLFAELALVDTLTDTEALLESAMRVGDCNKQGMELLSRAKWSLFGEKKPTAVNTVPESGPCILVSGHDMAALAEVLAQTEGKGINVYTHGDLISAHAFPGFQKYRHLKGHYGTNWVDQQRQFDGFPGAILMTSGCLSEPQGSYFDYIFTIGPTAWPEVQKITVGADGKYDFEPLIRAAMDSGGFMNSRSNVKSILNTGFGDEAAKMMASQIETEMDNGNLNRFVFIGGCDGPQADRRYYTDLIKTLSDDTVIITLGCGKFRFNNMLSFNQRPAAEKGIDPAGEEDIPVWVGSLPRMWDLGQCSDIDALFRLLETLSKVSGYKVEQLKIKYYVTWFSQTMVAGLLTLLAMGIKNIVLGPTLPAFIIPETAALLSERFGLSVISAGGAE